jgi:hypothetical protein
MVFQVRPMNVVQDGARLEAGTTLNFGNAREIPDGHKAQLICPAG